MAMSSTSSINDGDEIFENSLYYLFDNGDLQMYGCGFLCQIHLTDGTILKGLMSHNAPVLDESGMLILSKRDYGKDFAESLQNLQIISTEYKFFCRFLNISFFELSQQTVDQLIISDNSTFVDIFAGSFKCSFNDQITIPLLLPKNIFSYLSGRIEEFYGCRFTCLCEPVDDQLADTNLMEQLQDNNETASSQSLAALNETDHAQHTSNIVLKDIIIDGVNKMLCTQSEKIQGDSLAREETRASNNDFIDAILSVFQFFVEQHRDSQEQKNTSKIFEFDKQAENNLHHALEQANVDNNFNLSEQQDLINKILHSISLLYMTSLVLILYALYKFNSNKNKQSESHAVAEKIQMKTFVGSPVITKDGYVAGIITRNLDTNSSESRVLVVNINNVIIAIETDYTKCKESGVKYNMKRPRKLIVDDYLELGNIGLISNGNDQNFVSEKSYATPIWFLRTHYGWFWTPDNPSDETQIVSGWMFISLDNDSQTVIGGEWDGDKPVEKNLRLIRFLKHDGEFYV